MRSTMCAFWNCCSCHGGNGSRIVISWNVSHVYAHSGWSVICPSMCEHIDALNEICLWWHGVPGGGILLSCAKWPNSSQLKHCASGQCQWKRPVHPQTKHLSSLDIMLTIEGVSMAASCCAVFSFSTNIDDFRQSLRVHLINSSCGGMCISRSFNNKRQIATVSLSKEHHLAAVLKQWI